MNIEWALFKSSPLRFSKGGRYFCLIFRENGEKVVDLSEGLVKNSRETFCPVT